MEYIVILTTCASKREALRIAEGLLKARLVACANIMDTIDSRFWWKGKIDRAREALLVLKTAKSEFGRVEKAIKRLHSYEVPEIIALPVIGGSRKYLEWIRRETRSQSTETR